MSTWKGVFEVLEEIIESHLFLYNFNFIKIKIWYSKFNDFNAKRFRSLITNKSTYMQ